MPFSPKLASKHNPRGWGLKEYQAKGPLCGDPQSSTTHLASIPVFLAFDSFLCDLNRLFDTPWEAVGDRRTVGMSYLVVRLTAFAMG